MPGYFEFEVSLLEIRPRIWRRFLLRDTATLRQLHEAIQVAGPWQGYHLWEFCELGRPHRVIAGLPDDEADEPIPDGRRIKVRNYFLRPGDRCLYRYDFGDDWEHEVQLRNIVVLPETFRRRLIGGERAFPPEDCGSVPGYFECLAAVGAYRYPRGEEGPDVEDLAERRVWLGDWTPEFDMETIRKKFDR